MGLGSKMSAEMEPLAWTVQSLCFMAPTEVRMPHTRPASMRTRSLTPLFSSDNGRDPHGRRALLRVVFRDWS